MKKLGLKVLMLGFFAMLGFGALSLAVPTQTHAQGVTLNAGGGFGDNQAAGIAVGGTETTTNDDSLMKIVKNFINRALGLLGLIALVVLLRGGFQMVTAAGDEEKYKTGFKILKQAAVGLVFIGLSFFIVTMIFSVIGKTSGGDTTGVVQGGGGAL